MKKKNSEKKEKVEKIGEDEEKKSGDVTVYRVTCNLLIHNGKSYPSGSVFPDCKDALNLLKEGILEKC